MRRYMPVCLLCLLLLLSACGGNRGGPAVVHDDPPVPAAAAAPKTTVDLDAAAWEGGRDGAAEIVSLEYDLGEAAVDGMTFRIRGRLSLPAAGERLPLVLVLHGNHDGKNPDARFYEGFAYLTEYLARRGLAAASLDIQSAYGQRDDDVRTAQIAGRQLNCFARANGGEDLFPLDLTGRLDLDSVILAGHSRGGDAALNLGCAWENAIGVCAVAPNLRVAEKDWRDIPAVILVPQMDGDVDTLDGYAYLRPRWDDGLKSPTGLTLLEGANHNFFNASLSEDDAACGSGAALTPREQQDFLCRYLADFCEAAAGKGALLDAAGPAPGRRYGQAVRELWLSGDTALLSDSGKAAAASDGCRTRRITADSRSTDIAIPLSWGTDHALTFWEGVWERGGGAMDLPLKQGDLNGFDTLALDLAVMEQADNLTLVLTDSAGGSAGVCLSAPEPALGGSGYTLFSQIRVPLSLFTEVDLGSVVRCSLTADGGRVWVSAAWGR